MWARRGPGRPSTAEEFAADPTMLGFLLEEGSTDRWVFRRHLAVTRPLRQLGRATAGGVPFVAAEVALLFKAKAPRFKFHPPDQVRLFSMPKPGVLPLDDRAFVAVVRHGDILVWHYAFADHWFKVNVTTDPQSRLLETTAPGHVPPFAFNCDIARPMLRHSDAVLAVDLWLDVLVGSDGTTHSVYDHDEFNQATRHGWLRDREAGGARAGLEELTDLIERDALLAFLAAAHPFGQFAAPEAPAMRSVPLGEVPLLQPGVRPSPRPPSRVHAPNQPGRGGVAGGSGGDPIRVADEGPSSA